MPVLILANEATAARRRVYFHCVDALDGMTPETGEAGGQPQVSSNGAAWTSTGIGTLTAVGNGRYYADLTQTLVATAGTSIETRYKSANTAETPGDSIRVVAFDPYSAASLGLTNLDAAVSTRSTYAGGAVASVTGAVGSVAGNVVGSVGSVAAGGITAASFAAGALAAVKTSLLPLFRLLARKDAAVAADHATELGEINANTGTGGGTFASTTDSLEAAADAAGPPPPTANEIADAWLDRASAIDGKTPREALRIIAATTAGEITTAGEGTEIFLGLDGVTVRVTSNVDGDGNRSPVSYA